MERSMERFLSFYPTLLHSTLSLLLACLMFVGTSVLVATVTGTGTVTVTLSDTDTDTDTVT